LSLFLPLGTAQDVTEDRGKTEQLQLLLGGQQGKTLGPQSGFCKVLGSIITRGTERDGGRHEEPHRAEPVLRSLWEKAAGLR
jgi:hypothetical protein